METYVSCSYFEGFSVDEHGKQHYMDASIAYRQTCLRCIEYLRRYGMAAEARKCVECSLTSLGYDDYQIYLLLGCAPVQGHIAGIVDVWLPSCHKNSVTDIMQIPNACTTMGLPIDIFDFDISPHVPAKKRDMGSCAFASDHNS